MRDDDVYRAIKALMLKFLPELTPDQVVRGWNNRVPPPPGGFALMRILYHSRQATNFAEYDPPGESVTLAQSALVVVQVDFYGGPDAFAAKDGGGPRGASEAFSAQNASESASGTGRAGARHLADTWAQDFATVWRDAVACDFLAEAGVAPTIASDPRHLPLVGREEQYLDRWSVEVTAAIFDEIRLSQAFFDDVEITLYPLE